MLNRTMARIGTMINKKTIGPKISIIASKKLDKTCLSLISWFCTILFSFMVDLFSTECFFIQSSASLILDNSSRYLSLFCSVIGGGISKTSLKLRPLIVKLSSTLIKYVPTHKNLIFLQSWHNSYLQIELGESACSLLNRIKLKI